MHRLHHQVVRPMLEAVEATEIMEIGAAQGRHTALVQDYCRDVGGHLSLIDPELSDRLRSVIDEDVSTLHLASSLDVVATIPTPDVALVDGDHNYYTVRAELDLLAERAAIDGRTLPLIIAHDVWWPYGRRDMYYESARVPEEHQHPSDELGMTPGQVGKAPAGTGFNAGYLTATVEGGPRNGVLTAIEDFVADDADRTLLVLPVMHGLAIVVTGDPPPALGNLLEQFTRHPIVLELLTEVERHRVGAELRARNQRKENLRLREQIDAMDVELGEDTGSNPAMRVRRLARRVLAKVSRATRR